MLVCKDCPNIDLADCLIIMIKSEITDHQVINLIIVQTKKVSYCPNIDLADCLIIMIKSEIIDHQEINLITVQTKKLAIVRTLI